MLFAMRKIPGNLNNFAKENGFQVIEFPDRSTTFTKNFSGYESWLCATPDEELFDSINAIKTWRPERVVVDHYGIDASWESKIMSRGLKVLALDDLARPHEANYVLDQNYQPKIVERYKIFSSNSTLFLGPEFAILDPSFDLVDDLNEHKLKKIRKVLAFFGGADISGASLKLLCTWKLLGSSAPNLTLLVGIQNKDKLKILDLASTISNVTVIVQTPNIASEMSSSQLFIGAGGTVTWEKAKISIPSICITVATNQEEIAKELHAFGAHQYLGRAEDVTTEDLAVQIKSILANESARLHQHQKLKMLNVASRINEIIENLS